VRAFSHRSGVDPKEELMRYERSRPTGPNPGERLPVRRPEPCIPIDRAIEKLS
jgi:hypothetical protein